MILIIAIVIVTIIYLQRQSGFSQILCSTKEKHVHRHLHDND